jgi:predicted DNA-binding protein (UPF0251 family)
MTPEAFRAIVKLLRMTGASSIEAARLVLVEGRSQKDAAMATGLTAPGVSQAVRKCRAGLELAKIAAGVE